MGLYSDKGEYICGILISGRQLAFSGPKDTIFKVFVAKNDTFFKVLCEKVYFFQGVIFVINFGDFT